jgi:hypothetical protein
MHIVIFPILHSMFGGFFFVDESGGSKLPLGSIVSFVSGQSAIVCTGIYLYFYVLLAQVSRLGNLHPKLPSPSQLNLS